MNSFSPDNETRLLELLGQETELLKQVYVLTEKQAELLMKDDDDAFDSSFSSLADSMQKLIGKYNGLHQESDTLMQSYVYITGTETGKKIDSIEKATAQKQGLLSGCAALNEKNTALVKEKTEGYANRIEKLSRRRKSLEIYIPYIPNDPELLDKKM